LGIIIGLLVAIVAVWVVLQPLLHTAAGGTIVAPQPLFSDSDDEEDPLLSRRDRALAALKEIDFDRATGKLSDQDYEELKAQFSAEAVAAIKAVDSAESATGPLGHSATVDAVEALIASARAPISAGGRRFCVECGATLSESLKFCRECGAPVAALQS
jgi:hypothetical protein